MSLVYPIWHTRQISLLRRAAALTLADGQRGWTFAFALPRTLRYPSLIPNAWFNTKTVKKNAKNTVATTRIASRQSGARNSAGKNLRLRMIVIIADSAIVKFAMFALIAKMMIGRLEARACVCCAG